MTPIMTDIMTAMVTDMMTKHDDHKPRYCDGHREKRDKDYKDYCTYRKRYRSPCRHDPRKSERYPIALKVKLKNKWMKLSKV